MAKIETGIQLLSKILLFPLAVLYGSATAFRNFLYDKKFLKSVRFDFPVIGVGNLTAGGTGKTPQVEYLIELLQYRFRIATLSRGYGRTSHGFVMADELSKASQIGDEPRQFKKKFPETIVSVCEDRVLGVPKILHERSDAELLLLDDAFQHRAIRAGLSILLTEYSNPFTRDYVMPIGWLREARSNYHRADIIVVTKCPPDISQQQKQKLIEEIKPLRYQKIYFSATQYGDAYSFYEAAFKFELNKQTDVLLVCGIAKHEELKKYLDTKARNVYVREYRDHHNFDLYDLDAIRETFKNLGDGRKVIITTEKDAARLEEFTDWFRQNKIEIYVQPITTRFLFDEKDKFDTDILTYVETVAAKTKPLE